MDSSKNVRETCCICLKMFVENDERIHFVPENSVIRQKMIILVPELMIQKDIFSSPLCSDCLFAVDSSYAFADLCMRNEMRQKVVAIEHFEYDSESDLVYPNIDMRQYLSTTSDEEPDSDSTVRSMRFNEEYLYQGAGPIPAHNQGTLFQINHHGVPVRLIHLQLILNNAAENLRDQFEPPRQVQDATQHQGLLLTNPSLSASSQAVLAAISAVHFANSQQSLLPAEPSRQTAPLFAVAANTIRFEVPHFNNIITGAGSGEREAEGEENNGNGINDHNNTDTAKDDGADDYYASDAYDGDCEDEGDDEDYNMQVDEEVDQQN